MTRKSSSVTIRDVAKHAGVSVATISRYINRNAPVSQEVAERISQVMMDLSYAPHSAARHLATRRMRTIGLVLHNMHTDFFAPLLSGIESVVSENQYNLLVATYKSSSARRDEQPPVGPHNTDGMLVFADSLSEEQLTQLCRIKFPLVLIHRTPPSQLKIPFVTVENKAATRKMIDHLIDEHARCSIVFLRGPSGQEDSHWREQGYISSLEAHGLPVDPDLILDGEFDGSIAYGTIKNLLAKDHKPFDAVFAGDDDAAIGVLTALAEAGIRVPEDVSVAGFDDSRLSPFLSPPISTVRAPTCEVGRAATRQLFNLMQDLPVEQEILLPTEIILRRSCGCVREFIPGSQQEVIPVNIPNTL
jgi:LacI family transcriptional regulator